MDHPSSFVLRVSLACLAALSTVVSAIAAEAPVPIPPPVGPSFSIDARSRNGGTGFEAVVFTPGDPSPGTAATQLNPTGAPAWNSGGNVYGDLHPVRLQHSACSGATTWSIDFNRDGDFLDSEESATSVSTSLVGLELGYANLFLQGSSGGFAAEFRSVTINGVALGDFAALNDTPVEHYFASDDGAFRDFDFTANVRFGGGAGSERPRAWVRLGSTSGPGNVDGDSDGHIDLCDNCPSVANPGQADADADGIGDACEAVCGDGVTGIGEACDDGNLDDGDCCSSTCTIEAAGTTCRAAAGACDIAEECDGISPACPADAKVPGGTTCRATAGACDVAEECDGLSPTCPADAMAAAGTTCRAAAGDCDAAEECDGASATCPADALASAGTPCTDDGDLCTLDACDGAGACEHPAAPLASACLWAVTAGDDLRPARARTRLGTEVAGGVCADTAQVGQSSRTPPGARWVLLGGGPKTVLVRPYAEIEEGDVVTAGGCVRGLRGETVFDTGRRSICCSDGDLVRDDGGVISVCGFHPSIDDCITAKNGVTPDVALLDALAATQDRGRLDCSPESPCELVADGPLSVIDVSRMRLANDAVVTIDADGDPDAVVVVRIARGLKTRQRGTFELTGGAQASNVLFYVAGGNCDLGVRTVGAGALFCPAGKVRLRVQGEWNGALVGGRSVDIGDNALVTHVPFTGLAD